MAAVAGRNTSKGHNSVLEEGWMAAFPYLPFILFYLLPHPICG